MKVILLEDVKSVGKKGEVVTVKDGYAKNFILKKNLGVEATSKNLNDLKLQKQNDEKVAAENLEKAQEFAKELETKPLKLPLKQVRTDAFLVRCPPKKLLPLPKNSFPMIWTRKKCS